MMMSSDDVEILPARTPSDLDAAGRRAAGVLRAGGVVVHPTETVYGLGGDGTPENNALIARMKDRDVDRPLLLLTPDLDTLRAFLPTVRWPEPAERLARHFWPGPLTLIVQCPGAPRGLGGPGEGVAVRISPHPAVSAIFRHWGRPMTSTSANRSGDPPARTAREGAAICAGFGPSTSRPVLALDGGPSAVGTPSTIVTLVGPRPRLTRPGAVPLNEIREIIPELQEP
jgi:L-threonylcarbamoyladenylate synthase